MYSLAAGSPPMIPSLVDMGLPVPDPSVPVSSARRRDVPHAYWSLDPLANDCDRNKQTCRCNVRYQTQLVLTLGNSRAGFRQSEKHLPSIPCAALPTSLECALSWAGREGRFCLCVPLMPSLEQGRSYEMLLRVTSEDVLAKGATSSPLFLARHGWLAVLWKQFPFTHFLDKLVKYPLF